MKTICLATLACLTTLPLWGQSSNERQTRAIQFSIYAENNAAAALSRGGEENANIPRLNFSYFDGEELINVNTAADGFHGSFTSVLVDGKLRLYRPDLTTLEDIGPNALLAEIPVPDTWNEVLLYAYSSIGSQPNRFLALSERNELSSGRTLCLNLTGRPIAVAIGDTRILLDVNQLDTFDLNQAGEPGRIDIRVAAEWQENWRLALSSSRNLQTNESYLFVFRANEQGTRIYLRIVDLPERTPSNPS